MVVSGHFGEIANCICDQELLTYHFDGHDLLRFIVRSERYDSAKAELVIDSYSMGKRQHTLSTPFQSFPFRASLATYKPPRDLLAATSFLEKAWR